MGPVESSPYILFSTEALIIQVARKLVAEFFSGNYLWPKKNSFTQGQILFPMFTCIQWLVQAKISKGLISRWGNFFFFKGRKGLYCLQQEVKEEGTWQLWLGCGGGDSKDVFHRCASKARWDNSEGPSQLQNSSWDELRPVVTDRGQWYTGAGSYRSMRANC